ncbi:response regulator transcription factor [Paenibacillus soyae]|uniref:Response regulator transcription factor n=1 Tax=Paenibacillus soyae TaxID=2969249 RepID=A0A9X2SCP0_9BACL|nr:response regulator transcription factor [Paenibacillus soyae]MCR2806302.1 response regulator transcription factor [Paenibacillus soyae]
MYKLVLIDDEPIIREGLRTIVDWASFDIELCGECDNGLDGLALCRDEKPDIAIVDLKMPGMDGIELIEEARLLGIQTDFIVLSGYSDFTYAQKATEFGVRSYLVKPIEPSQLVAKLKTLRAEWEERDRRRSQWQAAVPLRVERMLQQLCEVETAAWQAAEADLAPFMTPDGRPWPRYRVFLLGEEREESPLSAWREVQEAIESRLLPLGPCVTGFVKPCLVVLTDNTDVSGLVDRLADEELELPLMDIVVAEGEPASKLSEIHLAYQSAFRLMKDKFLHGRSGCAIVPLTRWNEAAVTDVPIESYAAMAAEQIAAGDNAAIGRLIGRLEEATIQSKWQEARIKAAYAAFYVETVGRLAAIDENVRNDALPLHRFVEELKICCTLREACGYAEQELLRLMESWGRGRKHDTFAQLLDYVNDHYGAGLTLESLARAFHYNSSYLGKLFKAQTGRTFNAYVDELRMKQAKRMLAQGAKVYEVAKAVGYANVDYFHAKFKRLEGESPSAFRDRWGGNTRP